MMNRRRRLCSSRKQQPIKKKKAYLLLVIATLVGFLNIIILTPPKLILLSSNGDNINDDTTTTTSLTITTTTKVYHQEEESSSSSSSSFPFQNQQQQQSNNNNTTIIVNTRMINATIFYNIFVPNLNHSIDIVKEQLKLIQDSYIATTQNLTIYINVVGPYATIIEGTIPLITNLCLSKYKLNCIQIINNNNTNNNNNNPNNPKNGDGGGDEIDTLQSMYEYCQRHERERQNKSTTTIISIQRVGYMHNKGSYHDTRQNAKLRIPLTKAVSSRECWDPPNITCTSCGLVFLDKPFMQMPGNFFVSRCDYIIKLIEPSKFEYHQRRVIEKAKPIFKETFVDDNVDDNNNNSTSNNNNTTTTTNYNNNYQNRYSWIGIGRYASEHWGHSHPDVIPCDLSQRLKVWYRPLAHQKQKMKFQMYPRPALVTRTINQPKINFDDYYSIKGQIFKWYYLYNTTPPKNSWIWSKMDIDNDDDSKEKDHLKWKRLIYNKYDGNIHNFMMSEGEKYFLS